MTSSQEHAAEPIVKDGPPARPWVTNAASTSRWPSLGVGQLWTHRELRVLLRPAGPGTALQAGVPRRGVGWHPAPDRRPDVTILFNRLADVEIDGPSYFAFALLGSGVWSYFSSTLQAGTNSLLSNSELLEPKVAFPRIVAPTATFLPGLIDLAVAAVLAFIVALAAGGGVAPLGLLLGLPGGLVLLVLAVAGPVYLLSAAVVKYRDVSTLVGFGVQLMLFATPIAFPPDLVPPG